MFNVCFVQVRNLTNVKIAGRISKLPLTYVVMNAPTHRSETMPAKYATKPSSKGGMLNSTWGCMKMLVLGNVNEKIAARASEPRAPFNTTRKVMQVSKIINVLFVTRVSAPRNIFLITRWFTLMPSRLNVKRVVRILTRCPICGVMNVCILMWVITSVSIAERHSSISTHGVTMRVYIKMKWPSVQNVVCISEARMGWRIISVIQVSMRKILKSHLPLQRKSNRLKRGDLPWWGGRGSGSLNLWSSWRNWMPRSWRKRRNLDWIHQR